MGRRKVGFEVTRAFWVSRIYCITDIDPDHRKLSQLEAVVRFLTGVDPDLECECPNPCLWTWTLGPKQLRAS